MWADDGTHGKELWATDGTSTGTTLVKDINIGSGGVTIAAFGPNIGNVKFFVLDDGTHGNELWRTDGTSAGTQMVKELDQDLTILGAVGGQLYFFSADGVIYRTDGTADGTTVIAKDLLGASGYVANNVLYIATEDESFNYAAYKIDSRSNDLYYSDQWQVVEEQDAAKQTVSQYVWSPAYVDAMVERDRDTNNDGTTDERLYPTTDANYNVTALIDASTGDVVERYQYDPYGVATVLNDDFSADDDNISDVNWIYLHQGGRFDSGADLYSFRNRDYDAELGRWMGQDYIAGFEDGMNLYNSRGSNPLYYMDPSGSDQQSVFTWPGEPQNPRPFLQDAGYFNITLAFPYIKPRTNNTVMRDGIQTDISFFPVKPCSFATIKFEQWIREVRSGAWPGYKEYRTNGFVIDDGIISDTNKTPAWYPNQTPWAKGQGLVGANMGDTPNFGGEQITREFITYAVGIDGQGNEICLGTVRWGYQLNTRVGVIQLWLNGNNTRPTSSNGAAQIGDPHYIPLD